MDLLWYIVISVTIVILAIIYVWYRSRKLVFPSDKILELDGTTNNLTDSWYQSMIKAPLIRLDNDPRQIAVKYLESVHNLTDINPNHLVIGHNLNYYYKNITGDNLSDTQLFDIRSTVGLPGQIAIITNSKIRDKILGSRSNEDVISDLSYLGDAMDNNLLLVANNYIVNNIAHRWKLLSNITDQATLIGSYVYFKSDTVLNNRIKGYKMADGTIRINLLCSDIEFNALLDRVKVPTTPIVRLSN